MLHISLKDLDLCKKFSPAVEEGVHVVHIFVSGDHLLRLDIFPFLIKTFEDGQESGEFRSLSFGVLWLLTSNFEIGDVSQLPNLFFSWPSRLSQKLGRDFHVCVNLAHSCLLL